MKVTGIILFMAMAVVVLFVRTIDACGSSNPEPKVEIIAVPQPVTCTRHADCEDSQYCDQYRQQCKNACPEHLRVSGTICVARQHRPTYTCPTGHVKHPYYDSVCLKSCQAHDDCEDTDVCIEGQCIDACSNTYCIYDAVEHEGVEYNGCAQPRNHTCSCPPGFDYMRTTRRRECHKTCQSNDDCSQSETCRSGLCMWVCHDENMSSPCGSGATCIADGNRGYSCVCQENLVGDPYRECTRMCSSNTDCDGSEICRNHECIYGCTYSMCSSIEECEMSDHVPKCYCARDRTLSLEECEEKCEDSDDCSVGFCSNGKCMR